MERIIVTGANGMLASNIIAELLKGGYDVVGTVRSLSRYHGPTAGGVRTGETETSGTDVSTETGETETSGTDVRTGTDGTGTSGKEDRSGALRIVECDFKDIATMERLMSGCTGIVHAAAMTSQGENDYEKFRAVNVTATVGLVQAAIRQGLKRFLYVSSANTIGWGAGEGVPMKYPFTDSHYAVSKAEAEREVLKYADQIEVVIVNPTFMAGRYGTSKGANRLFNMVRRSPVVFCPKGGKSVLDVREAARGMVLAYEKGRSGENYLITGKNYKYKELFRDAARDLGRHPLLITVPNFLLRAAGWIGDRLHSMGFSSDLSKSTTTMLIIDNHYHADKARRELGFEPAPINFKDMLEGRDGPAD